MADRPLTFTPWHHGGSGPPLLLIHGFMDTWRTWELVLPALERRNEVLAVTLAGHAGGPPLVGGAEEDAVLDALEQTLDRIGWDLPHVAGNSLGGYLALKLAQRGRARTVTALAPAGGWAPADESYRELLGMQLELQRQVAAIAPQAESILATAAGRRAATQYTTVAYEHIPASLLAHQIRGIAACTAAATFVAGALEHGWSVTPELITCPVRVVWGTKDRLLPWPAAAARYRRDWLPQADWVVLDDVGHCPQLDVPVPTAELLLT